MRRGISLIEMIVVLAVVAVVIAVGAPSLAAVFDLNQRAAARTLADTYKLLQTEAMLRNVSFRVAFNVDRGSWKIEVGEANARIFSDPDSRARFEEERRDKLKIFTKKEIEAGEADSIINDGGKFSQLSVQDFPTQGELPDGCRFKYVYTPQYGEPVEPNEEFPEDVEDERIVYSHVFPDGTSEFTVVRIVDVDDAADGYTLEVEPFSGEVRLETEETEIGASLAWLPNEAPTSR